MLLFAARVEVRESDFYQMTYAEFLRWAKAYDERDQIKWHRWRVLVANQINVNVKAHDRLELNDIIELPLFDKEVKIEITPEQIKVMKEVWPKQ